MKKLILIAGLSTAFAGVAHAQSSVTLYGVLDAGIVYATDAAVAKGVKIAGVFPADSHPPITYPFALVKGADTPQAKAFLAYLSGPAARAVFEHFGFEVEGQDKLAHS